MSWDLNIILSAFCRMRILSESGFWILGVVVALPHSLYRGFSPNSHILGLDRLEDCIRVCNLKKEQLNLDRVSFVTSTSDDHLPAALGHIDYVILCGVYEHLLPPERKSLLHAIWNMLPIGGVLFIAQTPNRYSPIGTHVTRIPMVNFLPDSLAFHVGHWAMKKQYGVDADWERLLRGGFRGGTSTRDRTNT